MSRRTAMARLSPWAAEQWGMATAAQARRLGVSRVDLNRLVDDGTLELVTGAARVYRLTGTPEDPELDGIRAAWLQLGGPRSWEERMAAPDAVVSHRSAAHVRSLGDLIPHQHHFYVTSRRRLRRADLLLRVRAEIPADTWEISGGLPVSTVIMIIRDLLHDHEDESAVAQVVADALRDGLIDARGVAEAAREHAQTYGYATTSDLVAALVGESRPE